MRIEKVYATSKGSFWNKQDAEKKANRIRLPDGSRPGDPREYEPVREIFVLIDDQENAFELIQKFDLAKVQIK